MRFHWRLTQGRKAGLMALLVFAVASQAAVLPVTWGTWQKSGAGAVAPVETPLAQEYGLQETEAAVYQQGARQATVTVYRWKDPTSALAGYQALRQAPPQTVAAPEGRWLLEGNYVVHLEGAGLGWEKADELTARLPNVDRSAYPTLPRYLPAARKIRDSERYLLGPASLQRFAPEIPAALVDFSRGAEAQLARYRSNQGEELLLLVSYPTAQMVRTRLEQAQQIPNSAAKRVGTLLALSIGPSSGSAQRLIDSIQYQQTVTVNEAVPKPDPNPANFLMELFKLAGLLILLSAVGGIGFGLLRQIAKARFGTEAGEAVISLHLND